MFRFFSRVTALHGGIYNESSATIANPLVAFKLVKRLQSEWLNVVYSSEAEENLQGDFHTQTHLGKSLISCTV